MTEWDLYAARAVQDISQSSFKFSAALQEVRSQSMGSFPAKKIDRQAKYFYFSHMFRI